LFFIQFEIHKISSSRLDCAIYNKGVLFCQDISVTTAHLQLPVFIEIINIQI